MMTPGGEYLDDDGYFTCAVSVQHKKHEAETSSAYSGQTLDSEFGRKVVWPSQAAPGVGQSKASGAESIKTFQNAFKQARTVTASQKPDQPHKWLQQQQQEEAGQGQARVSRSRSKSRNIMERARSFERAAAESSRPASRNGSHQRSPSANRGQMEEMWMNQIERPASRTDVDSRRFDDIGRLQTSDWEQRIKDGTSHDSLPTRTPPPKRKELNMKGQDRNIGTPEPPPPPTRMTYPPNTIRDPDTSDFPPPPVSDGSSKLSEESVGRISEENKENIVKQWVESTTKSAEEIAKELEKFAYDIAETVVTNMERGSDKKETRGGIQSSANTAPAPTISQDQMYSEFWEHQTSISSNSQFVSQNIKTTNETQNELKRSASGSGLYFATPAHTTRHELHGPIYVQEDNRRVGMTFQQEERRREELRKQEEAKQEEQRRIMLEEQQRKAREEEFRKKEEYERQLMLRQQEEERRRMEELKRAEEEKRRLEEKRRVEEEKRRLEEKRRVEEEKRRQMELQKQEEERKQIELMKYEQLKREEELKRQEEMRLEQEMRKQYEMQQQKIKMEQQEKMLQQQKEMERQTVRDHIPKIPKNKTFEASQQDKSAELKHEDHLLSIKTGQVKEKRNFWMRSSSVDRVNNNVSSQSPAPRRRRIDWNAARKENDDPDSRPGSSLGQANTGSVRNLTSGFLAKSKSSAAIVQDDNERGRPKQRTLTQNGWTKERYDQELEKKEFFKSQELRTNKVNETVQSWGRKESGTTSGRSTPAPSRHIGETFAENKIAKSMTNVEQNKNANAWRTKTPEPSLKLVNVSVEKGMGSNQNIHISENAQRQMASFISGSGPVQQSRDSEVFTLTSSSFVTNTMSSQNSSIMSTSSRQSLDHNMNNASIQPPPAPERNQSFGGKSSLLLTESSSPSSTSTISKDMSEATAEKVASVVTTTSPVSANNDEHSVQTSDVNTTSDQCVTMSSAFQQPLQNSTSAQSINSVLSSCSSNALPLPVKAGWYSSSSDNNHEESSTVSTNNVSMGQAPEDVSGVLSPTKTGKTPVPVVASWFDNLESKFTNKSKSDKPTAIEAATSDLDDILDELIVADLEIGQKEGLRPESRQKIFMTDDADNMSVRSDVTVIEKKPEPAAEDERDTSILAVPQSPKEIRKKFQTAASSFEKSFTKSSEIEMSHEFKEGIKGKVKASKENFLKQMSSHQSLNIAENRSSTNNELQQIKLHRVASQGKIAPEEQDRSVDMMARQEKLAELEAVKRSRSKSHVRDETDDDVVQNSYTQEKREREMELIQLANRNANMNWEPVPQENQLKGERQREIEENAANRSIEIEELVDDHSTTCFSDGHYEAEWNKLQQENDNITSEMSDLELSQQIWNERAEELRQIANMRPKSPWKSQEADVDSKNKIRSTAAAWREREKSASRDRESPAAGQFTKDMIPTRRIGNLFNRDPDYWNLNDNVDDLPEPPPDMAPSPTPPTPVRQSSRGKIEEYSRDNARASPWRRC